MQIEEVNKKYKFSSEEIIHLFLMNKILNLLFIIIALLINSNKNPSNIHVVISKIPQKLFFCIHFISYL